MRRINLIPSMSIFAPHVRACRQCDASRRLSSVAVALKRFHESVPPAFVANLANSVIVSSIEDIVASSVERNSSLPLIGTHDGTFHCDEALACAMIKMLPSFEEAIIVRSRVPEVLQACDIVLDVGGTYDPESHRYDHHQREFDDSLVELGFSTKLSSAGLVYRQFGKNVLERLVKHTSNSFADADLDVLERKVYKGFIEHVDGLDNGIAPFDGNRKYTISTTLSDRVASLNPNWNETSDAADRNARFRAALQMTGMELAACVKHYVSSWWPARALVSRALDRAAAIHPSRSILELEHHCPWSSHLFQLEEERLLAGDECVQEAAKYVIFPDSSGQSWKIQAVPLEENSFATRQPLPESWRGLRDDRLSQVSGIPGCIFVHAAGFIGGHVNREGAVAMALQALTK